MRERAEYDVIDRPGVRLILGRMHDDHGGERARPGMAIASRDADGRWTERVLGSFNSDTAAALAIAFLNDYARAVTRLAPPSTPDDPTTP